MENEGLHDLLLLGTRGGKEAVCQLSSLSPGVKCYHFKLSKDLPEDET